MIDVVGVFPDNRVIRVYHDFQGTFLCLPSFFVFLFLLLLLHHHVLLELIPRQECNPFWTNIFDDKPWIMSTECVWEDVMDRKQRNQEECVWRKITSRHSSLKKERHVKWEKWTLKWDFSCLSFFHDRLLPPLTLEWLSWQSWRWWWWYILWS